MAAHVAVFSQMKVDKPYRGLRACNVQTWAEKEVQELCPLVLKSINGEWFQACPFIIDVYAEKCKPRLSAVSLPSSTRQLQKVLCKSAILKGEAKPMEGYESVVIYTYKNDSRITSVIENKSDKKIMMQVNNDQSKNCVSSRGLSLFAVEVPAKSSTVSQHVMAVSERQEWFYNCIQSVLS